MIKTATMAEIKDMIARGEVLPPSQDDQEDDLLDGEIDWDGAVLMPPMFDANGNRTMTAEEHDALFAAGGIKRGE